MRRSLTTLLTLATTGYAIVPNGQEEHVMIAGAPITAFLPQVTNLAELVKRQDLCSAGLTLCPDLVGCCPIGAPCGYSGTIPICSVPCDGPICANGGCCDLGYACPPVGQSLCIPASTPVLGGGGFGGSSSTPLGGGFGSSSSTPLGGGLGGGGLGGSSSTPLGGGLGGGGLGGSSSTSLGGGGLGGGGLPSSSSSGLGGLGGPGGGFTSSTPIPASTTLPGGGLGGGGLGGGGIPTSSTGHPTATNGANRLAAWDNSLWACIFAGMAGIFL